MPTPTTKYYKIWVAGTSNSYSSYCNSYAWTVECSVPNSTYDDTSHTCKPICVAPEINDPVTGACVSPPQPTCTAPQINDAITGVCITPYESKPTCVIPQNPLTAGCKWPESGDALNCMDGSVVYPPMTCPADFWDRYRTPESGQSSTCPDGSVSNPGQSCFFKYLEELVDNQVHSPAWYEAYFGHVFFGAGALPTITPIGPVLPLPSGLRVVGSEVRATFPLKTYTPDGASKYFNVESTLPTAPLGNALQKYLTSDPASAYASDFSQKATDAGFPVSVDVNTGAVSRSGSTFPLSDNRLAELATQLSQGVPVSDTVLTAVSPLPLPLPELTPFVSVDTLPWVLPGINAIQNDLIRTEYPLATFSPVNFPQVTSSTYITSVPSSSTEPLVVFTPVSPIDYVIPEPVPALNPVSDPILDPDPDPTPTPTPDLISDPSLNPNPTGSTATTSPTATPAPGTTFDPTALDTVPGSPTLYPDTYKYFDFLPMENPFSFDVSTLIPELPSTTCSYEIHRVIHVPFMAPKNFDVAPCVPLQPLRSVLQWAFAVLSAWTCFVVIFRSAV